MAEKIFKFIQDNQILSGTGVVFLGAVGWAYKTFFFDKKNSEPEPGLEVKAVPQIQLEKSQYKILFIDDQPFKIIDILRRNGWNSVKRLKDISSLEDIDVKEADVLFIDINGVGKLLNFTDEGKGLAKAIKEKFPTKRVILYSAESQIFHPVLNMVDKCLYKNADQYEFEKIIEDYFEKDKS